MRYTDTAVYMMIVMGYYGPNLPNLQPNFPVWRIGIQFMTWSSPSWTSWSKCTKIQFAQASGICMVSGHPEMVRSHDAWKTEMGITWNNLSWLLLKSAEALLPSALAASKAALPMCCAKHTAAAPSWTPVTYRSWCFRAEYLKWARDFKWS